MVGWTVLDPADADYVLPIRPLSKEEENIVEDALNQFRHVSRSVEITDENVDEIVSDILSDICNSQKIIMDDEQESTLHKWIVSTAYGLYFFDFIKGEDVEEITVIGPDKPVYVYRRRYGWQRVNCALKSEADLIELVNRMAKESGRRITYKTPLLDAVLSDGSRLHASIQPVSIGEITVRKFRSKPITPKEMVKSKFISADAMAMLSLIMRADLNVLVVGNTSSGKTTMLNALFTFVNLNERILLVEQTPEINIPHPHQVRLVANDDMNISLKRLVYESLRMRPDRIVVGEVRNAGEVEALFDVMLGGQARGAYATFHGRTPEEALKRMRSFGVDPFNLRSIDVIICQRRMLGIDGKEKRRVVSVSFIDKKKDPDNIDALVVDVFKYDPKKDKLIAVNKDLPASFLSSVLGANKKRILNEINKSKRRLVK